MGMPRKLYKYYKFNTRNITALKKQNIFFASPIDFNDPYDCKLNISHVQPTEQEYLKLYEIYLKEVLQNGGTKEQSDIEHMTDGKLNDNFRNVVNESLKNSLKEYIHKFRNERSLACFSSKKDDILMWAHYADGHRGFCLEFDTKREPFNKALEVFYKESFPKMKTVRLLLDEKYKPFENTIQTKYTQWEYEKEWRILHKESRMSYTYPKDSLTGVYLGSAMEFPHIEIIALILQGQNDNIQLYKGKRSEDKFSIKFEPVKYVPHLG